MFKPEKLKAGFRFKYNVPFRGLNFDLQDGVRINGLHFYRDQPKGMILYFHGTKDWLIPIEHSERAKYQSQKNYSYPYSWR